MRRGPREERVPARFLARRNLGRTPLRSGLSILAIIVGVVAVASLGMAGATLERSAIETIGDVGGDVIISPAATSGHQTLRSRDLATIRRLADTATVVSVSSDPVTVTRGRSSIATVVYRIDRPLALVELTSGRSSGLSRTGVLVGSDLARDLDLRSGNSIRIENRTRRIRGVIAKVGPMAPINPDRSVIDLDGRQSQPDPERVIVRTESGAVANETASTIRARLNDRSQRVSVVAMVQLQDRITSLFDVVDAILLGIGAISLGVGGLGILNVMLLSVAERRAEIGLLRAVGFRRRDVLAIVLWEATLLGIVGVSLGMLLSLGIGVVMTAAIQADPSAVVTPSTLTHLIRAAIVGVLVTVGSGLYPAWKAARVPPAEALRG